MKKEEDLIVLEYLGFFREEDKKIYREAVKAIKALDPEKIQKPKEFNLLDISCLPGYIEIVEESVYAAVNHEPFGDDADLYYSHYQIMIHSFLERAKKVLDAEQGRQGTADSNG